MGIQSIGRAIKWFSQPSAVTKLFVCATLVALVANEVLAGQADRFRLITCWCPDQTEHTFHLNDQGEAPIQALYNLLNNSEMDFLKDCRCYIPNHWSPTAGANK